MACFGHLNHVADEIFVGVRPKVLGINTPFNHLIFAQMLEHMQFGVHLPEFGALLVNFRRELSVQPAQPLAELGQFLFTFLGKKHTFGVEDVVEASEEVCNSGALAIQMLVRRTLN